MQHWVWNGFHEIETLFERRLAFEISFYDYSLAISKGVRISNFTLVFKKIYCFFRNKLWSFLKLWPVVTKNKALEYNILPFSYTLIELTLQQAWNLVTVHTPEVHLEPSQTSKMKFSNLRCFRKRLLLRCCVGSE